MQDKDLILRHIKSTLQLDRNINSTKPRTVILTGATGVVGSHVLYELLLQIINGDFAGNIVLVVRKGNGQNISGVQRIVDVLDRQKVPNYLIGYSIDYLLSLISIVECEFYSKELVDKLKVVLIHDEVYLIHSAASTNLAQNEAAELDNHTVNYEGSINLFRSCRGFLTKYIYISTAYACGKQTGIITDDYSKLSNPEFRNPYEANKFKTERKLAHLCKEANVDYQILRPCVVVGRLIDSPYYYLPKYNVVYAFAAFFHGLRKRNISEEINVRASQMACLHLVSVDYVAKAIVRAFQKNEIKELNIVPRFGCGLEQIEELLSVVGYSNYEIVEEHTSPQNPYQRVYQSKVASSFEPYINDDTYEFNNEKLIELMEGVDEPCVKDSFTSLIAYAVEADFGKAEKLSLVKEK